jgi:hypothetical protein
VTGPAPREALADALASITATAVNLPELGYSIVAEDMADALLAALSSAGYQVVKVEESGEGE